MFALGGRSPSAPFLLKRLRGAYKSPGGLRLERRFKVAIVGCPNVGKSVLFGHLTGRYTAVSNYPGTTVEIARGTGRWDGLTFEVVDTPGLYSLSCVTEEEKAARALLMSEPVDWLVHVVDGKNLDRMLPLTFQLVEAGFPVLVVVNMLDEVQAAGLEVDLGALSECLGLPVVGAVLTRGVGVPEIKAFLGRAARSVGRPGLPRRGPAGPEQPCGRVGGPLRPAYDRRTERAVAVLTTLLGAHAPHGRRLSRRALALLCLQEDPDTLDILRSERLDRWPEMARVVRESNRGPHPVRHRIPLALHHLAREMASACVRRVSDPRPTAGQVLGDLLMRPVVGLPVLAGVVYFGLYRFVGRFGAGTLVDALDRVLFLGLVNPWLDRTVDRLFASEVWRELLAHEYGVLTLGLRYAVAIVLPIVGTFFLMFSLLEDSGYLPRLALLADRVLKPLGLSGRALIPLTLGLGCGTMATLVTRTLETRRERVLATFVLALGVPCSAQLGVMMGVLSGRPGALGVWALCVAGALVAAGSAAAGLLPGRAAPFFTEVPPLRLPHPRNVWRKTAARMAWYFREVLPVFLAASVLIWLGRMAGFLPVVLAGLAAVCVRLGLPKETAVVYLFGFLRRDYGAAGLYDLAPALSTPSLVVASVTLTLFVPCLAQTVLMYRERGPVAATAILAAALGAALGSGYVLGRILPLVWGGAPW